VQLAPQVQAQVLVKLVNHVYQHTFQHQEDHVAHAQLEVVVFYHHHLMFVNHVLMVQAQHQVQFVLIVRKVKLPNRVVSVYHAHQDINQTLLNQLVLNVQPDQHRLMVQLVNLVYLVISQLRLAPQNAYHVQLVQLMIKFMVFAYLAKTERAQLRVVNVLDVFQVGQLKVVVFAYHVQQVSETQQQSLENAVHVQQVGVQLKEEFAPSAVWVTVHSWVDCVFHAHQDSVHYQASNAWHAQQVTQHNQEVHAMLVQMVNSHLLDHNALIVQKVLPARADHQIVLNVNLVKHPWLEVFA